MPELEHVKAENAGLRISDPHGALDRWRSLATDPAPMDGSTVLLAAFEESGRTGALFGVLGPKKEGAVLRFDGQAWSREPVDLPSGSLVWACAAEPSTVSSDGWYPLLPQVQRDTAVERFELFDGRIGGDYPPTHWRPI